ncbi:nuclear transport factor 2 family protein [Streptomyces sp. NPDC048425]|uniref:nuclear transport factor 2 family protein n=1 Tax=Streptomyces sp. NPDC048425 TaxID=3365548 RepID=UPI00371A2CCE
MDDAMLSRIQRLVDKEEIRDVMARYARAVDRQDLTGLREVYHPDAYDDHADYRGGIDGLLDYVKERVGRAPQVMHFLGQSSVEFASADTAAVESYFMTAHTLDAEAALEFGAKTEDGGSVQLSGFGRYVDHFERRDGAWKIVHRVVVYEAMRVVTAGTLPTKPDWEKHRRDANDPIFRLRAELGVGQERPGNQPPSPATLDVGQE